MNFKQVVKAALVIELAAVVLSFIAYLFAGIPFLATVGVIVVLALVFMLPSLIVPLVAHFQVRGIASALVMLLAGVAWLAGNAFDLIAGSYYAAHDGHALAQIGLFQLLLVFFALVGLLRA